MVIDADDVSQLQPKRHTLTYRRVVAPIIVVLILGGIAFFVFREQVNRNAPGLMPAAAEPLAKGDPAQARLPEPGDPNAVDSHTGTILGLGSLFVFFLVILVITSIALYFLPTIIAAARNHPNTGPIVIINVFLGWTLVGYAVSLAWAFMAIEKKK